MTSTSNRTKRIPSSMRTTATMLALSLLLGGVGLARAQAPAAQPVAGAQPAGGEAAPRKRRQPPPAVIPLEETAAAQKMFSAGNFQGAVLQAKAALAKNERFTPAMLVMAKAYYKLGKYEWTRSLFERMEKAGASDAERADMYQLMAFMELQRGATPQAIKLLKQATDARPENAIMWNNLGAQYLAAKNYREAVPALERAVQLQPTFAKAHMNLGSAYRGNKDYERAHASYQKALQLFPNYADVVFNLGILHLDADKMPNMDTTAKLNAATGFFQRYRQMLTSAGQPIPREVDAYVVEAQEGIKKEQKRLERLKKQEERERQRAAQKPAAAAPAPGGAPAAAAAQPAAAAPPPAPAKK